MIFKRLTNSEDKIYEKRWSSIQRAFLYMNSGCPKCADAATARRHSPSRRAQKTVILEIDPPNDEVSARRKAFYERAGYRANPFEHIHPPYHSEYKGHRLVVMTCPTAISENEYKNFNSYLENVVMKKITSRRFFVILNKQRQIFLSC